MKRNKNIKQQDELSNRFDKILDSILLIEKGSDMILTRENRNRIWNILVHKDTNMLSDD